MGWAKTETVDETYRSLIKFDTGEIEGSVTSATLVLRESECSEGFGGEVSVYRVTSSWSTQTTWSAQPTIADEIGSIDLGGCERWVALDITDVVSNWKLGVWENHGIELRADEGSEQTDRYFDSPTGPSTYPLPGDDRLSNHLVGEFTGVSSFEARHSNGESAGMYYSCRKATYDVDRPPAPERWFDFHLRCSVFQDVEGGRTRHSVRLGPRRWDARVRFRDVAVRFEVLEGNPDGPRLSVRVHPTDPASRDMKGAYTSFFFPRLETYAVSNQFTPYGFTGLRNAVHRLPDGTVTSVSYFCRAAYAP